jgi:hypothetical protein
MSDVSIPDYSFLAHPQIPQAAENINALANLQMSSAHAGLYSLEAAKQNMMIQAYQQYARDTGLGGGGRQQQPPPVSNGMGGLPSSSLSLDPGPGPGNQNMGPNAGPTSNMFSGETGGGRPPNSSMLPTSSTSNATPPSQVGYNPQAAMRLALLDPAAGTAMANINKTNQETNQGRLAFQADRIGRAASAALQDPSKWNSLLDEELSEGSIDQQTHDRLYGNYSPLVAQQALAKSMQVKDWLTATGYTQSMAARGEFQQNVQPREQMQPPVQITSPDPNAPGGLRESTVPRGAIPGQTIVPPPNLPVANFGLEPASGIPQPQSGNSLASNAYVARVNGSEGNAGLTTQNPRSSATGPGQFIDSTWTSQIRKLYPQQTQGMTDQQVLALRTNPQIGPQLQQQATFGYAKDNAAVLSQNGLPVNASTLGMAHTVGPEGAQKILQSNPNTPLAQILDSKAIQSNPQWRNMTAGTFAQTYINRFGNVPVQGINPVATNNQSPPIQLAQNNAVGNVATSDAEVQADINREEGRVSSTNTGIGGYNPPGGSQASNAQLTPAGTVVPPQTAGNVLAPSSITSTIPGAIPGKPVFTEPQTEAMKGSQKDADEVTSQAKAAETGMQSIPLIRQALQQAQTGPLGERNLWAQRWAQQLETVAGIQPSDDLKNKIAAGELLDAQGTSLAFELQKSIFGGNREAATITHRVIGIKPNLLKSPQGNEILTNSIEQDFQRNIDKRDFYNTWIQNPSHMGYVGAPTAFNKAYPVDMYASRVTPFDLPVRNNQVTTSQLEPNVIYDIPNKGAYRWDGSQFKRAGTE